MQNEHEKDFFFNSSYKKSSTLKNLLRGLLRGEKYDKKTDEFTYGNHNTSIDDRTPGENDDLEGPLRKEAI